MILDQSQKCKQSLVSRKKSMTASAKQRERKNVGAQMTGSAKEWEYKRVGALKSESAKEQERNIRGSATKQRSLRVLQGAQQTPLQLPF